jgi:general L-amino acid transport system substrate-binding protein
MNINSALELSGASVCTNTGTTTELNVADYFRANNMEYELVAFEKADEVVQPTTPAVATFTRPTNPAFMRSA